MVDESTIQKAVEMLHDAAPGSTVILFGSHARGDAGEDSDVDFLVVEPQLKTRRREMVRLRNVLRPLRIPVDVLVTSSQAYKDWSDTPGTIYYEVAQEGRIFDALL